MKIRSKFIIPITGLVILFAVISVVAMNMTVSSLVAEQEDTLLTFTQDSLSTQAATRQSAILSSIDQLGKAALKQAALFSEIPDIQDVYELALSGNINDENDITMQQARQKLRVVMGSYIDGFKHQTGEKAYNIHFHVPSGRSLARLWRDGWQAVRNGKKLIFRTI